MQNEKENYKVENLVGVPTDYSDENNWAHLPENADKVVDTLFIYPTLIINPDPDAPAIVPVEDSVLREVVRNHYSQAPLVFEEMTTCMGLFTVKVIFALLWERNLKNSWLSSFVNREQMFMLHWTTFLRIIIRTVRSSLQDTLRAL